MINLVAIARWFCSLALLYGVLLQAGWATALLLLLAVCAFEAMCIVVHEQGKRIAALELRLDALGRRVSLLGQRRDTTEP